MSNPSFISKVLLAFGLVSATAQGKEAPLDYEHMILLDAEDLAEQGIASAYERVRPTLMQFVSNPASIEEEINTDTGSYVVTYRGERFVIYSPDVPGTEEESWGRATYFFFHLINSQLTGAPVRFYAINGGNDLGGMFLAPPKASEAQAHLPRKLDWPYIPALDPPMYGQYH